MKNNQLGISSALQGNCTYQWIDATQLDILKNGMKVVLFGAGKGSEELLQFSKNNKLELDIKAIIDNDRSLQGKTLTSISIIPLSQLQSIDFDLILVTSVSGKESIAAQLEKINLIQGRDFLCVGRFPSGYREQCNVLLQYIHPYELVGKRCLHVGPGGFLGLEILLYSLGAERLESIDKFGFGMEYPDVTSRANEYRDVWTVLQNLNTECVNLSERNERFESLFQESDGRMFLNENKIAYQCHTDVESMPFEDGAFDYIFSCAVLEHVSNPVQAIKEMTRVTRPGGKHFHTIVTRDHRSYSAVGNFHPFSFRSMSKEEWEITVEKKFYQNRILPVQWRTLFEKGGMSILHCQVESRQNIDNCQQDFHSYFQKFTREELEEMNCSLLLRKRA